MSQLQTVTKTWSVHFDFWVLSSLLGNFEYFKGKFFCHLKKLFLIDQVCETHSKVAYRLSYFFSGTETLAMPTI
jgi:hypothetical protein